MRRKILYGLLVVLLAAAAFGWWWTRPLPVLTITTWAGTYGRAQASSQILPYGIEKRVDARIAQWSGNLDDVRRAVSSGQYAGDVIDFELPAAITACRENLLEPIDAASLPPGADGTAAAQDFFKGMVGPCFVASAIYSQMIVCQAPCALGDLGALFTRAAAGEKFGLQRSAKINLEMALLADGVRPEEVYAVLATEAGVTRAFARLDAIKPHIVWWAGANEPIANLRSGRTAFTTALTSEVQAAANLVIHPLQFYEADVLAIARGNPKKEMALDYIRYATGSAPLAGMARFAPFTPPRRSSRALVEKLPPSPTRDFVLSQKGALDNSFAVDDAWWHEHGAALESRFRIWVNS